MNPFAQPQRLRRFQVEITTGCNLACAGCPRTIGINEGHWRNKHMPVKRFAAVIEHAPQSDVLVLQGIGEPTLHPRLPEMLQLARASKKFTHISFNTNALFRELPYYDELRRHGLDHVSVSVDSLTPGTAEATRSGTDVNQLRDAVRYLIRLFGGGTTLSIVLSRMNIGELSSLLTELHGLGARLVEIQPLIAYADALENVRLTSSDIILAKRITSEAEARLPDLHVMHAPALTPVERRCRRPLHAGYVTVDGLLTPCCTTENVDLFGRASLEDHGFAELWQNQKVADWYEMFFHRDDAICVGCAYNPQGLGRQQLEAPESASLVSRVEGAAVLQRQGRVEEAAARFRSVLDEGGSIQAIQGLGETALQRGEHASAVRLLETVQQLGPSARNAHNLAWALNGAGRGEDALALMRRTVSEHAEYAPAYGSLARLLTERNERGAASGVLITLIRKALAARKMDVVESSVAQLLALNVVHPQLTETANHLRVGNRNDLARRVIDAVLKHNPGDLGAALVRCMTHLPVIYASTAEIESHRAAYSAELAAFGTTTKAASPERLAAAFEQVGQAKPFYLSYQGQDDRPLQEIYGGAIARIAQAAVTGMPAPAASPAPGEKIRIGFASNYFFQHSVSKLFRGWIEHLDRSRFEVFVYNLFPGEADEWASAVAKSADHARHRLGNFPDWAKAIAGDRLHALIFPELGMETTALRLACLRFAKVQCMTWGHPVTTGLPTIDYFLSSDLMEPANGDSHYSETLVRLPNLSVYYEPLPADTGSATRTTLGLRDDATVYVCCQTLYKYHAAYDRLFPAIAAKVPNAQFLLIADSNPATTDAVRARLTAAFAAIGLNAARHLVFTPPVAPTDFPALLKSGDIYLDSLSWSGGNTTLEAATCGLPIITLPGTFMRGRHSAAILRQMGLDQYIAANEQAYLDLAVRLGTDTTARHEAAGLVAANREKLFRDLKPVRALEQFLIQAVTAS
ncbi:MAG TPA: radical SAM protein [Magnetospirillaceae bacterium]|jgi:predicted O-linked N-acetylglucosamine transferase (SPINDLY family)/MoaA/NifB/PqqE/SkfB family radical SAM enzyme